MPNFFAMPKLQYIEVVITKVQGQEQSLQGGRELYMRKQLSSDLDWLTLH